MILNLLFNIKNKIMTNLQMKDVVKNLRMIRFLENVEYQDFSPFLGLIVESFFETTDDEVDEIVKDNLTSFEQVIESGDVMKWVKNLLLDYELYEQMDNYEEIKKLYEEPIKDNEFDSLDGLTHDIISDFEAILDYYNITNYGLTFMNDKLFKTLIKDLRMTNILLDGKEVDNLKFKTQNFFLTVDVNIKDNNKLIILKSLIYTPLDIFVFFGDESQIKTFAETFFSITKVNNGKS